MRPQWLRVYYCFIDLDGSSITIKVVDREDYLSHTEFRAVVVDCVPSVKCKDLKGMEVNVLAVDIERYIFNKVALERFNFVDVIYLVSGTLKPLKGYLVFIHGLPYNVLVNRLSVEGREVFYRDLYYSMRASLEGLLNELKDIAESNIKTLDDVIKKFSEIYKSYNEFLTKSLGFVAKGPEAVVAAEAQLAMLQQALATPPSPPQQVQAPAQQARPSLAARIKGFVRKLLRRGGG